jgi:protein-S-isoprenylcysteine O-methyltransferase Ste14
MHMDLIEKRIRLTWAYSLIVVFMLLFSTHSWRPGGAFDMAIEYTGLVLLVIASWGRSWTHIYIAGRRERELVTLGPYSIVRNPLYLFSFAGAAGIGLASGNIAVLILLLVGFLVYYPFVIRAEEKHLESIHGESFRNYCASVPRIIPRTLSMEDPEKYEVHPRRVRKSSITSLWFIWAFIILQVIEKMQETGLIPIIWRLP